MISSLANVLKWQRSASSRASAAPDVAPNALTSTDPETILGLVAQGDLVLLRAEWLLGRAGYVEREVVLASQAGGADVRALKWIKEHQEEPLPCRQAIEANHAEAIVSVAELRASYTALQQVKAGAQRGSSLNTALDDGADALPVISVSHCWETATNPDPSGRTLCKVASILAGAWTFDGERNVGVPIAGLPLYRKWGFGSVGVFFDFASLYQNKSKSRTPSQNASFKRALSSMHIWYAHKLTISYIVWGQDAHLHKPRDQRGWPYFEASMSVAFKEAPPAYRYTLDGVKHKFWSKVVLIDTGAEQSATVQEPPIGPTLFRERLSLRSFTNGADAKMVNELYGGAMVSGFRELTTLRYAKCGWSQEGVDQLAAALSELPTALVQKVDLSHNEMTSLIKCGTAMAGGALASLRVLDLSRSPKLISLPAQVAALASLRELNVAFCSRLTALPSSPPTTSEASPAMTAFACLEALDLAYCTQLRSLPDLSHRKATLQVMWGASPGDAAPKLLQPWEDSGRLAFTVSESSDDDDEVTLAKMQTATEIDDLHAAVASFGGIVGVIGVAKKQQGNAAVQAHFVGLVRDLCDSDEIADEIAAAGGVEAILDAGRLHYDSADVALEFFDAVVNLTQSEQIAKRFSEGGGLEIAVECANRHVGNEDVSRSAAGCLWALSATDDLVPEIRVQGAHQAALAIARAYPKDEELQISAAALIRNLSMDENFRLELADVGGIEVLISAARNLPHSSELVEQVSKALWNLSQSQEVVDKIIASGGVEVLLSLSKAHTGSSEVQLGVLGAMRLITISNDGAAKVVAAGGLPVMLAASRAQLHDKNLQRQFLSTLLEMAASRFESVLIQAGAIPAIIEVMDAHSSASSDPLLPARAAAVLRLLVNPQSQDRAQASKAIGLFQGCRLLAEAASRFPDHESLLVDVLGAFAAFVVDDTLKTQVLEAGGIAIVVDALQSHEGTSKPYTKQVRVNGFQALSRLTTSARGRQNLCAKPEIKALISQALGAARTDSRTVTAVAVTISNLLGGNVQVSEVLDDAALERLVACVEGVAGMDQSKVANGIRPAKAAVCVCKALEAVAGDIEYAAKLGQKAEDALVACRAAYLDNEDVVLAVNSALQRLPGAEGFLLA